MKKTLFCNNWEFCLNDTEINKSSFVTPHLWQSVNLPHDWSTEHPFEKINASAFRGAYAKTGVGWYRKAFNISKDELEKRLILYFDGVFRRSTLYINGQEVGGRAYGYISFWYDIKQFLKEGLNLIAVKVDNTDEPASRWYNGCGITRNVWLYSGEAISIPPHGVQIICSDITPQKCNVSVNVKADNADDANISIKIFASNGEQIATSDNCNDIKIQNPKFWDIDTPQLYSCEVTVSKNGLTDTAVEYFGVRTVDFIPHKGLFLNGKNIKIKGVCNHHDAGCLGAAVPKAVWKKRLLMLKEMGCNAVRTAHNPFDPYFYDLCDELGLLVMDESFDSWDVVKADHDYGKDWVENYKKDISDLVIRDRNHPCVFIWSIGNEVKNMKTKITHELMDIVHELDPTRLVTCGVQGVDDEAQQNRAILDVAGYNDGGGACFLYSKDHEKYPEHLFIATEAPHTFQTRGFYRTQTWWRDHNLPRIEIDNLTDEEIFFDGHISFSSSYDNCGVRTCARDSWALSEKYDYLCGEFRWTGFDYLGECGLCEDLSRSYGFGVIDTANFEKDHYYLYKSMWTAKPMVHILPHWTHDNLTPKTKVPVWVYTNCEVAELFLNGKSLGRKIKGERKNLEWLVEYVPGELTSKAYTGSEVVAEMTYKTALAPCELNIKYDNIDDDSALAQLVCTAIDKNGTEVPYADCLTEISVSNCKLLGSDNGNPLDVTLMKSANRRTFNGKCLYILGDINPKSEIVVAGLLGKRHFENSAEIYVSVKNISPQASEFCTRYTLDSSEPNANSPILENPITIHETTQVKVKVYKNNKELFYMCDIFVKGAPEPVIDTAHLNYLPDCKTPPGPFAKEICGTWESGGFNYSFEKDGVLNRLLGNDKQHIGHWWYDFPSDDFEAKDYAGTGQIWFLTGEKCKLALTKQKNGKLVMDNTEGAISFIMPIIKTETANKTLADKQKNEITFIRVTR